MSSIYIAEDEGSIRGFLNAILGPSYNLDLFDDGQPLLDAYRKRKPDLVITDNDMPSVDGWKVVKAVREDIGDLTPIIFMTGRPDQTVIDYVSSKPNVTVLTKPLNMGALKKAISDAIGPGI